MSRFEITVDYMNEIKEYINKISIVDCHEHLLHPSERVKENTGFFDILQYVESDLCSAGMKDNIADTDLPINKKIDIFMEYYPHIKNTAYGKMISYYFELYGIKINSESNISTELIMKLDEKIKKNSNEITTAMKWYDTIFKEKCNIKVALSVHNGIYKEYPAIKPIVYLDFLLKRDQIEFFQKKNQHNEKTNFQNYMEYVDNFLERQFSNNVIAGKFGTPYWRSINFDLTYDIKKAENDYYSGARQNPHFESFLFHYLLKRFEEKRIPVQFHTGHVTPSAADMRQNQIGWSNPEPFGKLSYLYPYLTFILLHTGFPYQEEYFSLVKNIQNLYADFSWIYIVSPARAKLAMHMALDMIPSNKIIGFGGDCYHVETLYAHLCIAKSIIADVFSEKAETAYFSIHECKELIQKIMYENPKNIYRIGEN